MSPGGRQMRVLLDTNVLISALLFPGGSPSLVYAAVRAGVFELIVNRALLAEVADVLGRPKLQRYVTVAEAADFMAELATVATLIDTGTAQVAAARVTVRDAGDAFLLDLVRVGAPSFFVTGDQALLDQVSIGSTLIVSPGDLRLVLDELADGRA